MDPSAPKTALIVAHGAPSDPAPAAAELAALAARVALHLPDWQISSVTLAEQGGLARAVTAPQGVVFPMFMSGGWFTRVALARKLEEAGGAGWQVLEPFGCDPAVHELAIQIVAEAVDLPGALVQGAEVLIAAHGSFKSSAPSGVAHHLAQRLRDLGASRAEAAFIDQTPQLRDAAGYGPNAVCLPFFAARGGHVADDLPRDLAGFAGRILPHLGGDARVPALIARAIAAGAPVCADECRYARCK